MTETDDGLVCAYRITPDGEPCELNAAEVRQITCLEDGDGWVWIHRDCDHPGTTEWLENFTDLPKGVALALGSGRNRPRAQILRDGVHLTLRGLNLNPGADPHEMLSARIWMNDKIVITTRRQKIMAINDIRKSFQEGDGPRTPAQLVVALAQGLVERLGDTIERLDDELDDLEDVPDFSNEVHLRPALFDLRSRTITLLRYIRPQRGALADITLSTTGYFNADEHGTLNVMANRVSNQIEALTEIRDRSIVIHDAITAAQAEQMNKVLYLLTVITALFLPLTLFTGLLGINVGGIPGEKWPPAFWVVLALMAAMGGLSYYVMRKMKLL